MGASLNELRHRGFGDLSLVPSPMMLVEQQAAPDQAPGQVAQAPVSVLVATVEEPSAEPTSSANANAPPGVVAMNANAPSSSSSTNAPAPTAQPATSGVPWWGWALAGLAGLGVVVVISRRRRRKK